MGYYSISRRTIGKSIVGFLQQIKVPCCGGKGLVVCVASWNCWCGQVWIHRWIYSADCAAFHRSLAAAAAAAALGCLPFLGGRTHVRSYEGVCWGCHSGEILWISVLLLLFVEGINNEKRIAHHKKLIIMGNKLRTWYLHVCDKCSVATSIEKFPGKATPFEFSLRTKCANKIKSKKMGKNVCKWKWVNVDEWILNIYTKYTKYTIFII